MIWNRIIYWLMERIEERTFGAQRSPLWRYVRAQHLKKNPTCAVCGGNKEISVHHKKPVHLFKELELSPDNLITLCEGSVINCHFVFGHCFLNWNCYNPNVDEDVKVITNIRRYAKKDRLE